MSRFGDLVKKLRKEKDLTLEAVAKKIGSHKGCYVDNSPIQT